MWQFELIQIYLKERKEKGEGILAIIHDNNKADIRYYLADNLPYKDMGGDIGLKITHFYIFWRILENIGTLEIIKPENEFLIRFIHKN